MNWREKIVQSSDRVICALIAVLVLGSVLGFGGAVWWFRPVMAVAAFLLVAIKLAQSLATGRMPILKSPLGLLGLLALGLGVVQLAPLPAGLASRLSPAAHEAYARGLLPRLVHTDDPEASLPEAPQIRSPA
ncbi:MAG: O-antigen ligase family protein, partial [Isosphaeraceae bacterium]